jgi:N-acyl homoserine lactone hydrolase
MHVFRSSASIGNPFLKYRLIDGDTVLLPGVELLETSGHVQGHQSVLVRLPQAGTVLLTIDAIPAASMLDPETRVVFPGNDEDEKKTRASTRKLVEIARHEGVKLIIHGHDHQQWPILRHAQNSIPRAVLTPCRLSTGDT